MPATLFKKGLWHSSCEFRTPFVHTEHIWETDSVDVILLLPNYEKKTKTAVSRCYPSKVFLRIWQYSQKKTLCWSLFYKKVIASSKNKLWNLKFFKNLHLRTTVEKKLIKFWDNSLVKSADDVFTMAAKKTFSNGPQKVLTILNFNVI